MFHLLLSPHNPDKQLGPDGQWIDLKTPRQMDLHGRKKTQMIFDESALLKAVQNDGDVLAERRLFELGKPIWHFVDDSKRDIDDSEKLVTWMKFAREGYLLALNRVAAIKLIGNIGLEILADEGNPNAKNLLDERVLNQEVRQNGLWLSEDYDSFLHDYVNRTKKSLPDCMVFLYLLPLELRRELHESFNAKNLAIDMQVNFVSHFFIEPEYDNVRLSEARVDQNAIEEGYHYTFPDPPLILIPFKNRVCHEIRNSIELFLQYPEPYYMRKVILRFFIKCKNIFTSNDRDSLLVRSEQLLAIATK